MLFRLEMVTVPVADVDRARAFYVEQLGFTVEQAVRIDLRTCPSVKRDALPVRAAD